MSRLLDVARSYKGTPYINGAMVKGAGVDCCTLPVLIYKELGIADIQIKAGYPADWYCRQKCEELLLPYLEKFFYPVDDLQPLDLISYEWGRSRYAHIAMYLGDGLYIHCDADHGAEIVGAENPAFYKANGASRSSGIWRLKDELF